MSKVGYLFLLFFWSSDERFIKYFVLVQTSTLFWFLFGFFGGVKCLDNTELELVLAYI